MHTVIDKVPSEMRFSTREFVHAESRSRRIFEPLLWCILVLVIGFVDIYHTHGPRLYNDSYQYLSIASNMQARHECSTSIVHFDVERAHGKLPAPETTLALGYPLAIWVLSWTGLPLERAGLLVSLLAAIAATILLWVMAKLLSFPKTVQRLLLLLWAFNATAGLFWTSLLTESLFTAVSFGALVLLVLGEQRNEDPVGQWAPVAAFALAGIAYWIRYAGILIAGALVVYAVFSAVRDRARVVVWIRSVAALCVVVLAGMLRNLLLTGTWKGGNNKAAHKPIAGIVRDSVAAVYQLAMGPTRTKSDLRSVVGGASVLLVIAGLVLLAVFVWRSLNRSQRIPSVFQKRIPLLFVIWLSCYCAGIIILGVVSPITFGTRLFFPIVPVALVLACMPLAHAVSADPKIAPRLKTVGVAGYLLFLAGYLAGNLTSMFAPAPMFEHQLIAGVMEQPMKNGESLSHWVGANIPRQAVVVADDGQATAYVLKRNTVSIVEQSFSDLRWNERETQSVMSNFGADYLILFPGLPNQSVPAETESDFLHGLDSNSVPPWLDLVAQNSAVRVFHKHADVAQ